jgi:hypothetical protein
MIAKNQVSKSFVKGQTVIVYLDPITKTNPEGAAILDTFHSKDQSGEWREVVFESYPFGKYTRKINY